MSVHLSTKIEFSLKRTVSFMYEIENGAGLLMVGIKNVEKVP